MRLLLCIALAVVCRITSLTNPPSKNPTKSPTTVGTVKSTSPSRKPASSFPTTKPTSSVPSRKPSAVTSAKPSAAPSKPSVKPTIAPSAPPTKVPTSIPSFKRSSSPSKKPSFVPTPSPTFAPTFVPTITPSAKSTTSGPSKLPTSVPTSLKPSFVPTLKPSTSVPTVKPSSSPTKPTTKPSASPTVEPTVNMQKLFTSLTKANNITVVTGSVAGNDLFKVWSANYQTASSYNKKSKSLKLGATSKFAFVTNSAYRGKAGLTTQRATYLAANSFRPTVLPTPTPKPVTRKPSAPTRKPSAAPSNPTARPSAKPTAPTCKPTAVPSGTPSRKPSAVPTAKVTGIPTVKPSSKPSVKPTLKPSSKARRLIVDAPVPTEVPSFAPSLPPVEVPTASPFEPLVPSADPASETLVPTADPAFEPLVPSADPASEPLVPTADPASEPLVPSFVPTEAPSLSPSLGPSVSPSLGPSVSPSSEPSSESTSIGFGFRDWSAAEASPFGSVVAPVRDAGQICVSAWAWVIVGAVESALAIKRQAALVPLSVQQVVNCESGGVGFGPPYSCDGGDAFNAFRWMLQTSTLVYNGMTSAARFPYTSDLTGVAGHCIKPAAIDTGSKPIAITRNVYGNGALDNLKAALDLGPVVVAVTASSVVFQLYLGGVITDLTCGDASTVDHYLLAVGYGVIDGIPYIKCKNSWGVNFGDSGYVLIGADEASNYCGILTDFSYPTMP